MHITGEADGPPVKVGVAVRPIPARLSSSSHSLL